MAGTDFDGTANSWTVQTNKFSTTGTQSTWGAGTINTFYLTGVILVLGSEANVARLRTFSEELALAQRYFSKSFNTTVVVGASTNAGAMDFTTGTTVHSETVNFPVELRATPTVTIYSTDTGTAGVWRNASDSAEDSSNITQDINGTRGFTSQNGTTTADKRYRFGWSADARL